MKRVDIMVKDLKEEIMDNLSGWGNSIEDIELECNCLFTEHTGVEVVHVETYKELGKVFMVVYGETRDADFKNLVIKLELAEVEEDKYTPINIF